MHRFSRTTIIAAGVAVVALAAAAVAVVVHSGDTSAGAPFSIAVLPDTQAELGLNVSAQQSDGFADQVTWLIANRRKHHIALVIQVGDVVGNAECLDQWTAARAQLDRLTAAGMRWQVASGNHDDIQYNSLPVPSAPGRLAGAPYCHEDESATGAIAPRSVRHVPYNGTKRNADDAWVHSAYFDRHIPIPRGTVTMAGSESASYLQFSAGGIRFLSLTLPFGPRPFQVAWANKVVAAHPDSRVLFTTHDYLGDDNQLRGIRPKLLGYGNDSVQCYQAKLGGAPLWYPVTKAMSSDGKRHCNVEDALPNHPGGTIMPGAETGYELYDSFISRHPNIQFTFSGHVVKHESLISGVPVHDLAKSTPDAVEGYQRFTHSGGAHTYSLMFNAQGTTHAPDAHGNTGGGDGYLRLYRFAPKHDTVQVSTPSASPGYPPFTAGGNAFTIDEVSLTGPAGKP